MTVQNSDEKSIQQSSTDVVSEDDWRVFDPNEIGAGGAYGLGISAVAPRPIAVITSQSSSGVMNCAPYS